MQARYIGVIQGYNGFVSGYMQGSLHRESLELLRHMYRCAAGTPL